MTSLNFFLDIDLNYCCVVCSVNKENSKFVQCETILIIITWNIILKSLTGSLTGFRILS